MNGQMNAAGKENSAESKGFMLEMDEVPFPANYRNNFPLCQPSLRLHCSFAIAKQQGPMKKGGSCLHLKVTGIWRRKAANRQKGTQSGKWVRGSRLFSRML